ncbi:MAG: hypothetical protein U5L96_04715 [Owenweeksia sp.]|nr:hypothetical protein [Owenweeksia sp.]
MLEAGLQDAVANKMKLDKLHPQSHLYTSDQLIQDFPGKGFALQEIHRPWSKSLKGQRLNVISRNFTEKANVIAHKLRLKPSQGALPVGYPTIKDGHYAFLTARLKSFAG